METPKYYAADFETTDSPDHKSVRVWCGGVCEISENPAIDLFGGIQDFWDWCIENCRPGDLVFFHNLKFDGAFLCDFFERNEVNYDVRIVDGRWYEIHVNGFVRFRDSYKLLPFPLRALPKAFGIDDCKRDGDFDYNKVREPGEVPKDAELEYLLADVRILSIALYRLFDSGFDRRCLTISSFAKKHWQKTLPKGYRKEKLSISENLWRDLSPAYHGGIVYVNPDHKMERLRGVDVFDVNSLYPYIMSTKPVPVGKPQHHTGLPKRRAGYFDFVRVYVKYAKLQRGEVPHIYTPEGAQWREERTLVYTTMSRQDYERALATYAGEWEVIETWRFATASGLFDTWLTHWQEEKIDATIKKEYGRRTLAKLTMNGLSGKFGQKLDADTRAVRIDPEGNCLSEYAVASTRSYKADPSFVPIGAAITTYARAHLLSLIDRIDFANFCYCDTDSVHVLNYNGEYDDLIDDSRFGALAHEGHFDEAIFVRRKCYGEKDDDGWHWRVAGLPPAARDVLTPENLRPGLTVPKARLLPRYVPGGVRLDTIDWSLTGV